MANAHKDKVFDFFKNLGFRVKLFYKPTNKRDDLFYHIILDSVIELKLRIFNDNFIVINSIVPLTSEYMETRYETMIQKFINQDEFSIAIERLGNTNCINSACIKAGLPCVVDDRFITIPKKLYNMYKKYHRDDENKCGLYIAAVIGDFESISIDDTIDDSEPEVIIKEVKVPVEIEKTVEVPVEVIKEVEVPVPVEVIKEVEVVKEVIKEVQVDREPINIDDLPIDKQLCTLMGDGANCVTYKDTTIIIQYMNLIEIEFSMSNIGFDIVRVSPVENITPPSNVYYMQSFEKMENILDYYDIIVRNIRNETIYKICELREYEKIIDMRGARRTFGSYKMKKYR